MEVSEMNFRFYYETPNDIRHAPRFSFSPPRSPAPRASLEERLRVLVELLLLLLERVLLEDRRGATWRTQRRGTSGRPSTASRT